MRLISALAAGMGAGLICVGLVIGLLYKDLVSTMFLTSIGAAVTLVWASIYKRSF